MRLKQALLSLIVFLSLSTGTIYADPVTKAKAQELAKQYLIDGTSARLVRAHRQSLSSLSDESCAPYYIFSRGEDKGYVIVSGDNSLPEILGYTDSGDFDENNIPPALADFLQHYANLVEFAQANNAPARTQQRINDSWTSISPMVKTKWHQTSPYNDLCPYITGTTNRAVTGCVATAAAQVIYFFHADNPDSLLAKTPTYSYGDAPVTTSFPKGTPMKYDLMQLSYSNCPAEMNNAVATFMACVGAATYLTYGSSTAGQLSDLVNTFNSYFNLSSTYAGKWNFTQSSWETAIYNDLKQGRPMAFSGYNETDASGHAIVLDGYSNGKFHFNFGWGGQGDGYYTLDEETGIGGFSTQQQIVYKVAPKKQNISGYIVDKSFELYHRTTCDIKVHIDNHGTMPYSGVYLLTSINKTKPSVSSSSIKETATSIAPGEGADFILSFKPSLLKPYYIYLTDKNSNILDSISMDVNEAVPNLCLKDFTINSGDGSETVNQHNYQFVNNTTAKITAIINNASNTPYEGTFKVTIQGNSDASEEYSSSSTKTQSIYFEPQETKEIVFTSNTLTPELYYLAQINSTSTAISTRYPITAEKDTFIYFRSKASDLACDSYENGCAKISGNWNDDAFVALAADYPKATSFDLTAVKGVTNVPTISNLNALFYVADEAQATGVNIIQKGICQDLRLYCGYSFNPHEDFTAVSVTYDPLQPSNVWQTLYLPFDCQVPEGCLAKKVVEATRVKMTFENVSEVKAGTPYLYTFTSDRHNCLSAQNALITTKGTSIGDSTLIGTYTAITSPENALLLNFDEDPQYFMACDSVEISGLTAYLVVENGSKIRPTNITTDPRYKLLGIEIQNSYNLLDENLYRATDEGINELLNAINNAEDIFVAQELTSSVKVIAQTTLLQEAESAFILSLVATERTPVDYTSYLINPSFELKSIKGWTVEEISGYSIPTSSTLSYYCSGTDGDYYFNASTNNTYNRVTLTQTVTGIPKGKYRIKALITADEGKSVKLFANEDTVNVSAHKFGKYYFNEGEITVNITDTILTLGVKGESMFKADGFQLYCLENDFVPTAIEPAINDDIVSAPSIQGGKGSITVLNATANTALNVYNIAGMRVGQINANQGSGSIEGLKAGIYIVGKQKIAVK